MINSLTLKHWRTHKETTLEFGKGTNVIVGVMGSGKSSIVNAISYSLFGTFPSIKTKQVSLKEIIMNKPNQENKAETIIEFTQGEKKYRAERIIRLDGTNEAKLYENNKLIAGPKQKDVNEKIEAILGLNYELFSRAAYSEQNEMDFFLKLTPGDRKKKFDELLELEKYEEARKNAVTLQNELIKENKQKREFIIQQKETVNSHEEEKILKQINEEEKLIREFDEKTKETNKQILILEKEFNELSTKEKQNKLLEEQIIKITSKIETLKEDLKKSEKVSLKDIIEEIEKTKKSLEKTKEKIVDLEKKEKEIIAEQKKIGETLKVAQHEKQKLLEEEKGVMTLKGKCPTCKQELSEEHKKELIIEITKKLEQTLVKIKENEKNKTEIDERFSITQKELTNLRKENENHNKNLYKLEAQQREANENGQKNKQLAVLLEELPRTRKQLNELGFDKKKIDFARENLYKNKTQLSILETKIKSKKELTTSFQATLNKITQIKNNITELEKTLLKNEQAATKLGVFANCLIATQQELRGTLLETINNAMSRIWITLYPYADFVDARLCITTEGYDLQVQTRNNEWVRVEGILSGGERSAAALCIRMAFALVLTKKLSILILDEPTHNLDSNAVQKLSTMLREEMPKLVEQIFVITHDKELESAASGNLYLLNRNKDLDEPTRTEILQNY